MVGGGIQIYFTPPFSVYSIISSVCLVQTGLIRINVTAPYWSHCVLLQSAVQWIGQ